MNLLRIILLFFAIYFFRRVYQFYQFVKKQKQLLKEQQERPKVNDSIDVEYKVID